MKIQEPNEIQRRKGSSTEGIAHLLGISESFLSEMLSGIGLPFKELALRISETTGIPVLNLLYPQAESHEQPSA